MITHSHVVILIFKRSPNIVRTEYVSRSTTVGHAVWTSVSATCSLLLTVPILVVTCAVWPRRGKPVI